MKWLITFHPTIPQVWTSLIATSMYSGRPTLRDSHCSAPPLQSSFCPPRLSREAEAVLWPRAPLRPTKQEVRESEASSVEYCIDETDDVKVKVEAPIEVVQDSRQMCVKLATVRIKQPAPTASSSAEEFAEPSGTAYHTQALRRIPSCQLGTADPPRGRGRPKGSKSRPRVSLTFGTSAPPEQAAAAKARAEMAPRK